MTGFELAIIGVAWPPRVIKSNRADSGGRIAHYPTSARAA